MNKMFRGAALLLLTAMAHAAQVPPPIYDPDPQHIFNRLYAAIAIRTAGGEQFGIDKVTAFHDRFDDSAQVAALAGELVARKELVSSLDGVKRALLLHDVWTAFDTAAAWNDRTVLRPLAQAVRVLAMDAQSIGQLPDNYADAVRSGEFAPDFDPEHPDRVFLPPDLFDPKGAWVQIGDTGGDVIATMHLNAVSARSAFLVFIRCPGGREATLGYLNALNLFRAPFTLEADPTGTAFEPQGNRPVRMSVVRLNQQTPQFPAGTIFALVRQMVVVNDKLQPAMTRITQSIQFRVYQRNDFDWSGEYRQAFAKAQRPFEVAMTRADLLARRRGGLHRVAEDERSPDIPIHAPTRAQELRGPVVLSTCVICHGGSAGILSVNTYTGQFDYDRSHLRSGPQLMPASDPDHQREATLSRKRQRYDWGVLQGILVGE